MGIVLNHCIGIRFISKDDILYLFDLALKIKSNESIPQLNSQTVAHVFLSLQLVLDCLLKRPLKTAVRFQ